MSASKKTPTAFQMPVDEDEPARTLPSPDEPKAKPAAKLAATAPRRQESRIGKKNLSVWIDETAHRELKILATRRGMTVQHYMVKLINQEFAKNGLPEMAE